MATLPATIHSGKLPIRTRSVTSMTFQGVQGEAALRDMEPRSR